MSDFFTVALAFVKLSRTVEYKLSNAVALVLAGGRSERLFPLSLPKPLLEINNKSLLDHSLNRLKAFKEVRIVCNSETADQIKKYRRAKGLGPVKFLIEPEPRDTAAAVGFALRNYKNKPPRWLAVLSADQFFPHTKGFDSFLKRVAKAVSDSPGSLFLAGSPASTQAVETHSQFGWILPKSRLSSGAVEVRQFIEKPKGLKLKKARSAGGLINCGMFFGTYESFRSAYQAHYPDVFKTRLKFSTLKKQPIDKAIFENFDRTKVLKLALRWEDLGTWEAVEKYRASSQKIEVDALGNFVQADTQDEVYIFGLHNLLVAKSGKKILIMPKEASRNMKMFLKKVKA